MCLGKKGTKHDTIPRPITGVPTVVWESSLTFPKLSFISKTYLWFIFLIMSMKYLSNIQNTYNICDKKKREPPDARTSSFSRKSKASFESFFFASAVKVLHKNYLMNRIYICISTVYLCICIHLYIYICSSLPETNIAPKKGGLEDYIPFGMPSFQVLQCVSFREGSSFSSILLVAV